MSKLDILREFTNEELIQALKRRESEFISRYRARLFKMGQKSVLQSNQLGIDCSFYNPTDRAKYVYFVISTEEVVEE